MLTFPLPYTFPFPFEGRRIVETDGVGGRSKELLEEVEVVIDDSTGE
jgi:hypothetical protein